MLFSGKKGLNTDEVNVGQGFGGTLRRLGDISARPLFYSKVGPIWWQGSLSHIKKKFFLLNNSTITDSTNEMNEAR